MEEGANEKLPRNECKYSGGIYGRRTFDVDGVRVNCTSLLDTGPGQAKFSLVSWSFGELSRWKCPGPSLPRPRP